MCNYADFIYSLKVQTRSTIVLTSSNGEKKNRRLNCPGVYSFNFVTNTRLILAVVADGQHNFYSYVFSCYVLIIALCFMYFKEKYLAEIR